MLGTLFNTVKTLFYNIYTYIKTFFRKIARIKKRKALKKAMEGLTAVWTNK